MIDILKENILKRTILVDLDGVLNTYIGNFEKDFIPPIKEGTKEFLENLSEDFVIRIFTTRNKILATKWLIENDIDKYIDDRWLTFNGNFSDLINQIKNFKPHYKFL